MSERLYQCSFCSSRFVHESRFIKHRCKQQIRDEHFRTPIGQQSWFFYQQWMKAYRRIVPNPSAFLKSKFYTSFVRFAEFSSQINIPDTGMFILLMREKDISPTIWTNDQVYAIYVEHLDRKSSPQKQADITVNAVFGIADKYQCQTGDIFDVASPNEIIQLIRQRHLSPWILLHSSKFKHFFVNGFTTEERIIAESIIRPPYWKQKFTAMPSEVARMKLYVAELSL